MMNRNMLKQAQAMQKKMQDIQQEIAVAKSEASVGGGVVKVVVVGGSHVESIKIASDVVDAEDVEMLEDLVMAAVNEAMDNAQEMAAKKMEAITGGLNIPGLGF